MNYRERANRIVGELALKLALPDDFPGAWLADAIEKTLGEALFEERGPWLVDMDGKELAVVRTEPTTLEVRDAFGLVLARLRNVPPAAISREELITMLHRAGERVESLEQEGRRLVERLAEGQRRIDALERVEVTPNA